MEDNTTYRLTESERRHISDVQAQINAIQSDVLQLEGQIHLREREQIILRRHLSHYVGQIASEHHLPMGSVLSPDFATLTAREAVTNGG